MAKQKPSIPTLIFQFVFGFYVSLIGSIINALRIFLSFRRTAERTAASAEFKKLTEKLLNEWFPSPSATATATSVSFTPESDRTFYVIDVCPSTSTSKSSSDKHTKPLPIVVCLHGFPDCWASWKSVMQFYVERGHRVIVPQLRGYAGSHKGTRIGDYALSELTNDVRDLVQYYSPNQNAILCGHDWGSAVAFEYARLYSSSVKDLIIFNGVYSHHYAKLIANVLRNPRQFLLAWYILCFQFPYLPERLFNYNPIKYIRIFYSKCQFSADEDRLWTSAWQEPGAMTGMLNYYRAAFCALVSGFVSPKPDPAVFRLHVPILYIYGVHDTALVPENGELEEYCNDTKMICVPSGGHWVQREAVEDVRRILSARLAERM